MERVPEVRAEKSKENMDYGEYMEMLQSELPVSEYMLDTQTAAYAIVGMFAMTVVFYFLLPVIMFGSYTLITWFALVAAFIGLTWVYYDYVYYPNEVDETENEPESARGDDR